jgi:hypothetical protein
VDHLRVFGSGAYVYLPENVRKNKLAPKSELMAFIGYQNGIKGFKFMRLHNNSIFLGGKAQFDEKMFPLCKNKEHRPQRHQPEEPIVLEQPLMAPSEQIGSGSF